MAFINANGLKISYDCAELIAELRADIAEFGGHMLVDVITQVAEGVIIYKDYFPRVPDEPLERDKIELIESESWQVMTATALLMLYEKQNSIL